MKLSYRTRCALKRIGQGALIAVCIGVAVYALWLTWLNRYVVYTRNDGAVLDFSTSVTQLSGQVAVKPEEVPPISIYYSDGQSSVESEELLKLKGYYVTGVQLERDLEGVLEKLQQLPKGTAVIVDVKSIYGNFFYSSTVSEERNPDLDTEAMDRFIETINSGNLYTIARVPGLRDRKWGIGHVMQVLQMANGYGWMDGAGCYWLNPNSTSVQDYLAQTALELRGLGFREVLFSDFCFPDTKSVVFNGNREQALSNAAQTLVKTCASDSFTVSFEDGGFPLPEGRTRLYVRNVSAANVETYAQKLELENAEARLVFLTELHDTRYEQYGVLRPLN